MEKVFEFIDKTKKNKDGSYKKIIKKKKMADKSHLFAQQNFHSAVFKDKKKYDRKEIKKKLKEEN